MNKFLVQKIKLANLDWFFLCSMNQSLVVKHKLINFDWIDNSNCSWPVSKLSELNKRINTEAAAHWADVLRNRCS